MKQLIIPSWIGNVELREYSSLRDLWESIPELGEWQVNLPHSFLWDILDYFYILERETTPRGYKRSFKIIEPKPLTEHLISVRQQLIDLGVSEFSNVEFKL